MSPWFVCIVYLVGLVLVGVYLLFDLLFVRLFCLCMWVSRDFCVGGLLIGLV